MFSDYGGYPTTIYKQITICCTKRTALFGLNGLLSGLIGQPPTEKSGPGASLQGLIKRIISPARSRSHNLLDTSEGAVPTVHRDDDTGDEG